MEVNNTHPRFRPFISGLAAACLLLPTFARTQQPSWSFAIKNVRIFDGQQVLPRGTALLVKDGLIAAVAKDITVPEGIETIDGVGHTLLPGFIDAHTHADAQSLKQALVLGVTTELDMANDPKFVAQVKKLQAARGNHDLADLFSAGAAVTAPGGHGTQFGMRLPTITTPEEAEHFVEARISEGSDYIKIIYDDGHSYGVTFPSISKATMATAVAGAHKHGKLAVVHVSTLSHARDAIDARANGLVRIGASVR